jgi:hypothetical protein
VKRKFRQVDGAQEFKRTTLRGGGQALHRDERAADAHSEQPGVALLGESGADRLGRLADIEPEVALEDAVHDDRGQVALLELEPDIGRVEGVLDRDRRVIGKPEPPQLEDGPLAQSLAHPGIMLVRQSLVQDAGARLVARLFDGLGEPHEPAGPVL